MTHKLKSFQKRFEDDKSGCIHDVMFIKEYSLEIKEWLSQYIGVVPKWSKNSTKSQVLKYLQLLQSIKSVDPAVGPVLTDILSILVVPGNDPEIRREAVTAAFNIITLLIDVIPNFYWLEPIGMKLFPKQPEKYENQILGIGDLKPATGNDNLELAKIIITKLSPEQPEHFQYWWSILSGCIIPFVLTDNQDLDPKMKLEISNTILELFFQNLTLYRSSALIGFDLEERIPLKHQDNPLIRETFHANMLLLHYAIQQSLMKPDKLIINIQRLQFFFEQVFQVEVLYDNQVMTTKIFDKVYAEYNSPCKSAIFVQFKQEKSKKIEYVVKTLIKEQSRQCLREFISNSYEALYLKFKLWRDSKKTNDILTKNGLHEISVLFFTSIQVFNTSYVCYQSKSKQDAFALLNEIFTPGAHDKVFKMGFYLSLLLYIMDFKVEYMRDKFAKSKSEEINEIITFFGRYLAIEYLRTLHSQISQDIDNPYKYLLDSVLQEQGKNPNSIFHTTRLLLVPSRLNLLNTTQMHILTTNFFAITNLLCEGAALAGYFKQFMKIAKQYGKNYTEHINIKTFVPKFIKYTAKTKLSDMNKMTINYFIEYMSDNNAFSSLPEEDQNAWFKTVLHWLEEPDGCPVTAIQAASSIMKNFNGYSFELVLPVTKLLQDISTNALTRKEYLHLFKAVLNITTIASLSTNRDLIDSVLSGINAFYNEVISVETKTRPNDYLQLSILTLISTLSSINRIRILDIPFLSITPQAFTVVGNTRGTIKKWTILNQLADKFIENDSDFVHKICRFFDDYFNICNIPKMMPEIIHEVHLFATELATTFPEYQSISQACSRVLETTYTTDEQNRARDMAHYYSISYKNSVAKFNAKGDKCMMQIADEKFYLENIENKRVNTMELIYNNLFEGRVPRIAYAQRSPNTIIYYVTKEQEAFSKIMTNKWDVVSKSFYQFVRGLGKNSGYKVRWSFLTHTLLFTNAPGYTQKHELPESFDGVNLENISHKAAIFWIESFGSFDSQKMLTKFDMVFGLIPVNKQVLLLSVHCKKPKETALFNNLILRRDIAPLIVRWIIDSYYV